MPMLRLRVEINNNRVADEIVKAAVVFTKDKASVDDSIKWNLAEQKYAHNTSKQATLNEWRALVRIEINDLHFQ